MSTALLIIDVQHELCFGSEAGFAYVFTPTVDEDALI